MSKQGSPKPMTTEPDRPVRKRRRPTLACYECRRRKVRCDRNSPCAQCKQHGLTTCSYYDDHENIRGLDVFSVQNRSVRAKTYNTPRTTTLSHTSEGSSRNVTIPSNDGGSQDGAHVLSITPSSPRENAASPIQTRTTSEASLERMRGFKTTTAVTIIPPSNSLSSTSHTLHGFQSKTRVFGAGHWMSAFAKDKNLRGFKEISGIVDPATGDISRGLSEAVLKCKELARDIKAQNPGRGPLPPHILRSLPNRDITDHLIPVYFNTFESCYRILHVQLFHREYTDYLEHPGSAKSTFLLKLLLVTSVVACLHADITIKENLRKKVRTWIHAAEVWLSAPLEKRRLTLDGIQIYCLLLLARQTNCIGSDLVWISAGSLMRMGIQMGLHQDPVHFEEMSLCDRELRRRLWFTIMEMNVQSALDSGMSAMIISTDYDTQPPSNLDDADLVNPAQSDPLEKPTSVFTQSSFQRILTNSLPLRLEAIQVINNLQAEPTYDEILHLGSGLASVCREAVAIMDGYRSATGRELLFEFKHNSVYHSLRRFLLCLHRPYALRALQNPLYSYSSKICLETAHIIISLLSDETHRRLMINGGGMFRDIITNSAPLVFVELISQLEEDGSEFMKERNKARRQPLLDDAKNVVKFAEDRVRNGETNVKGYVFLSMAMGQVEALQNGTPVTEGICKATNESLALCYNILKSTAARTASEKTINPEEENHEFEKAVSESYSADLNFDFLDDGTLDFDAPGSWILGGLEEKSWF
ncbi:hypothetical protein B7463_g11477, partial [Scytalidium lignicola]